MKPYLSEKEICELSEIIKTAEDHSTGEIRVHVDSTTEGENETVTFNIFRKLEMHKTKDRNAVLFHINFNQRYLAIIGDEGIHQKVCQHFWNKIHNEIITNFGRGNYFKGIKDAILKTGIELKKYFPVEGDDNPNELPNEITFS